MKGNFCSPKIQRLKYIASDWLMHFLAFALINVARYYILRQFSEQSYSLFQYISTPKIVIEQFTVPFLLLIVAAISGFYNQPFHKSRLQEFFITTSTAAVNALLLFMFMMSNEAIPQRRFAFELIICMFLSLLVFTYIGRLFITTKAIKRFKAQKWSFTTLILGNSRRARETGFRLSNSDTRLGYNVIGYVEIPGENQSSAPANVYSIDNIEQLTKELKIDQIIISPEEYSDTKVLQLLDRLYQLGVPLKIEPDTLSYVTSAIRLTDIFGEPFVDLSSSPLSEFRKNIKRLSDAFFSLTALILLSPLLLILAIMVKLSSPGPVIYRQERIGQSRKPFNIYKFRSMVINAEANGPSLSSDSDKRITPVGQIMRKYRLDELPQFWNVLKGDMSLVGPRPERDFYIQKILRKAPYYSLLHQVRPGITSWGMVKFGYASTVDEMVQRTQYDLLYISNMSLTVDTKILIYTIRTVVKGLGK